MSESLEYFNFNQDRSLLLVGSMNGFSIYRTSPIQLIHHEGSLYADIGCFGVVEMYENSRLLALVGATEQPSFNPRRLTIWNVEKRSVMCETSLASPILRVCFNSLRIVALTVTAIYIYDINTMRAQHVIHTAPNPKGLVALSSVVENCLLLYPISHEVGLVCVYDCFTMRSLGDVEAHKSPLAAVALSYDATMMATASEKGTVIRVFGLPAGQKVYSFKRGICYVEVCDLSFAADGSMLLLCASSGTIHIFRLAQPVQSSMMWSSFIKQKLQRTASLILPRAYEDTVESNTSFIRLRTHSPDPFKAALLKESSTVLVVTKTGKYQVFAVDFSVEGEGTLEQEGYLSDALLRF
jgi:autophagy-related protein 18